MARRSVAYAFRKLHAAKRSMHLARQKRFAAVARGPARNGAGGCAPALNVPADRGFPGARWHCDYDVGRASGWTDLLQRIPDPFRQPRGVVKLERLPRRRKCDAPRRHSWYGPRPCAVTIVPARRYESVAALPALELMPLAL